MKDPYRLLRHAASAVALTLVLAACTPAPVGGLFAPCPVPSQEAWEASQEQWLMTGRVHAEPGHTTTPAAAQ